MPESNLIDGVLAAVEELCAPRRAGWRDDVEAAIARAGRYGAAPPAPPAALSPIVEIDEEQDERRRCAGPDRPSIADELVFAIRDRCAPSADGWERALRLRLVGILPFMSGHMLQSDDVNRITLALETLAREVDRLRAR